MSTSSSQPVYPAPAFNEYNIAFEGSSVACILYGIYVVIALANLSLLRKKRYKVLLVFTLLQLVVTTVYFAVSLYAAPAQRLVIFQIGDSSGPDALSPWPAIIVDVALVLNTWASDGLLLYRCHIIYMGNRYALAFAALLYLGTLSSSLAWLTVSSEPNAVYSTHSVQVYGTWYFACSVAMNACVSILISARLWMHRQTISRAIGSPQGGFHLGYMAMTLESALLYTVFVIVALVMFTTNSPLENVFFPVLGIIQVIAPAMIIYRIARGISFETDEFGTSGTGSMRFSTRMTRPRATLRPVRQDILNGSETIQAFSEHEVKTDQDGSDSFVHGTKDHVDV